VWALFLLPCGGGFLIWPFPFSLCAHIHLYTHISTTTTSIYLCIYTQICVQICLHKIYFSLSLCAHIPITLYTHTSIATTSVYLCIYTHIYVHMFTKQLFVYSYICFTFGTLVAAIHPHEFLLTPNVFHSLPLKSLSLSLSYSFSLSNWLRKVLEITICEGPGAV
jgi:hypothetical protein